MIRVLSLLAVGGLLVSQAHAEQVVISKLMYNPAGKLPEFVEVYNNTATPFDIARWRLAGGVHFEFPEFSAGDAGASFLKPFERIVLCGESPEKTRAAYDIPAGVRLFGPWSGKLDNAGERVTLKDKNGITVCTIKYGTSGHWPAAADGAGHALVLKDANRAVDDWRNWTVSARPGGAPGTAPVPSSEQPAPSPELDVNPGLALLDWNTPWRFDDGGRDLGTAWRAPDFDDGKWPSGPAILGFTKDEQPGLTIRTTLKSIRQMTCYFRARFEFSGETNGLQFALDQVVDDGAVYYLNGREIARSRMFGGEIKYNSPASQNVRHTVEEANVFAVNGALLKKGANVLAAEVHQYRTNSTDLLFAARLRAFKPRPPTVMVNELFAGSAQSGFVEFFNATAGALNLKGHFLSDTPADHRKYRIARNLALEPGGLAVIGLAEAGFSLTNPVSVYLTAPDGATVLCAVSADFSSDARSLGRKPAGGAAWFRFPEPSRGLPNVTEGGAPALRLNEVHFAPGGRVDWVEVFNPLETVASAQGLFLSARRDFSDETPLSGALAPGGFVTANVSFPLTQRAVTLYLVNAAHTVLDSRVFREPPSGATWQAFPDGSSEWYSANPPTRGAPNHPRLNTDVVINEIMFDPPSALTNAAQFIELFNRGRTAMDLSGWELAEGITYTFPAGASIAAGGYLVVTSDANHLREAYGNIPMAGNFKGRLSHHGELIQLLDRAGNLANQVDYRSGGDWPELAAGGGSSMELINPWMDNRLSSAWRDSDESQKSVLREYSCGGKYEELHVKGGPSDYKELHFHLVGDAHVVLENIFFGKQGSGRNYILNGTKLSDDGYSAKGWLCQGNHWASTMTNGQFHLIADGHGDNRPNRAEIDVVGMNKGETCELKFNARWVSGKPRLIAQTWDHSIAGSFLLDVPKNLGTPGRPNSRFVPSPAPQVDALAHTPAVPRSTNAVRITARVFSSEPLESVRVFHRLDNERGDGVWTNVVMRDDGLEGDARAGDGIYTAELPSRPSGQLVQFHVLASAKNGQTCSLPRVAADKPALYLVDDRPAPRDLRTARFLVWQHDVAAIADGDSAKYGFKYPRHSNRYFNCTFISNEEEIFYGGEIRNSGSPWTRGGGLDRVKLKLPADRLFRGHEHFYFDNDPAGGNFHNRVTRYWLYLMGHVVNENEIVRVVVNNSGFALREDTEPVHNDFLNRNFKHGNRGQLYRIDDEWWFTDTWDRDMRDADWGYKGSDNPGRYRTEWMKRSNETEDDYGSLIDFFKFYTAGKYTQDEIEKRLDPRAILPYTLVRGYIGDWDTFTMGRGKNGYFYQRPDGGPFQFLHWDSDLAFGDSNSGFYGGRVAPWIEKPYNLHLFNCYLLEFHEKYAGDSLRFRSWLQAEEDASKSYSPNMAFYTNFALGREASVRRQLSGKENLPLKIAPLNSANTVTNETVTLTGAASYRVFAVELEQSPKTRPVWKDATTWRFPGVPLKEGRNVFVIRGFDGDHQVVQQASITVTRTNAVMAVKGK